MISVREKGRRERYIMYVFRSIKICYFLTAPMSCIINMAHAKRHTLNLRHVGAIHETTYKTWREFSSQSYMSARYIEKTWIQEKPANVCHAMNDSARCSSIVFLAIDSGVLLIINASIDEAWNIPGTGLTNSRTTPPRPVAFFVDIISLFPADCATSVSLLAISC